MRGLAGLAAGMLGQEGAGLGVLEQAMRAALTSAGARLLEAVLAGSTGYRGPRAWCGCGWPADYAGCRPKTISTVLGPVTISRAWYHCGQCRHGFAPRDQQLGISGGWLSPGLTEMTALAGAEVSFARAAALLAGLAGITLSARTIERSAEATGAAARAAADTEAAAIVARVTAALRPVLAGTEEAAWKRAGEIEDRTRELREKAGLKTQGHAPPNAGAQRLLEAAAGDP